MEERPRSVNVNPRDIAVALDGISDWVRSVRSAVLQMDSTGTATLEPLPVHLMAPPAVDEDCPPPRKKKPVVKKKTGKKVKKKKTH